LLKLDTEDDPTARSTDGRMEHAYMLMARAAGILTATTHTLADPTPERTRHHVFVERFDCHPASALRSHLLSLAGALHTHNLTYSHLLVTTRRLTADHNQVLEAVRRMLFNVRSGNADDHGKNHSFIYQEAAKNWALSPAYDLTLNYAENAVYHGLFPTSFGSAPRLPLLAATAADAGVSPQEFAALDAAVQTAINRWPEFAERAKLPQNETKRAARIHARLAAELATRLSLAQARRGRSVQRAPDQGFSL
jgi:serine/threonine-protein kinase HipA